MHKPSLAQLVYEATFPRPRAVDPASFSAHITRNLVPEVRIETSAFYGSLDCIEAQYPGLDYSYGPHRMRLSRFQWHRKLFKVFDELRLTPDEISSLCRWEGTKSARERYEKEEGVVVRDTTGENVRIATPPPAPSIELHPENLILACREPEEPSEAEEEDADVALVTRGTILPIEGAEESSDEELESYGVQLHQRLLEATAARERGANVPLDEDWEQWLKETSERGNYLDISAIRAGQELNLFPNPQSPSPSSSSPSMGPTMPSMSLPVQLVLPAPPSLHSDPALRASSNQASETAR